MKVHISTAPINRLAEARLGKIRIIFSLRRTSWFSLSRRLVLFSRLCPLSITAFSFMEGNVLIRLVILIVQYLIVPLAIAFVTHTIFTRMNLYNDDVFKFVGEEE